MNIEGCQSNGSTIVLFTFKQVLCPLECMNMYLLVLNLREITMGGEHSVYVRVIVTAHQDCNKINTNQYTVSLYHLTITQWVCIYD